MKAVLGLCIGFGALAATPALADPPTRAVPYTSADLETPEAVAALHARVEEAADEVCRAANVGVDNRRAAERWCKRVAVRVAIEEAGVAPLAAYHEASHGERHPALAVADAR